MQQETCNNCGATLSPASRLCPACQDDVGAPNVREAEASEEKSQLQRRYQAAKKGAEAQGLASECEDFEAAVLADTKVVVAMPPNVARLLFSDPSNVYQNYETLVGAGVRTPKPANAERKRKVVNGWVFGPYAEMVTFGALSFTNEGLSTYGQVFCTLRSQTIDKRVSFLETNSYRFAESHSTNLLKPPPAGYRAVWSTRHQLAVAKLASKVKSGDHLPEWQRLLVKTDGKHRRNDDFIEAHIFGQFNSDSIESIAIASGKISPNDSLDADIVVEKFNQQEKQRKLKQGTA